MLRPCKSQSSYKTDLQNSPFHQITSRRKGYVPYPHFNGEWNFPIVQVRPNKQTSDLRRDGIEGCYLEAVLMASNAYWNLIQDPGPLRGVNDPLIMRYFEPGDLDFVTGWYHFHDDEMRCTYPNSMANIHPQLSRHIWVGVRGEGQRIRERFSHSSAATARVRR